MPSKALGSEGGWIVRSPTSTEEGNKAFFIRVWKPLPSRRVLKTLWGSPKGKAQSGQNLVAVGLDRYRKCLACYICLILYFYNMDLTIMNSPVSLISLQWLRIRLKNNQTTCLWYPYCSIVLCRLLMFTLANYYCFVML